AALDIVIPVAVKVAAHGVVVKQLLGFLGWGEEKPFGFGQYADLITFHGLPPAVLSKGARWALFFLPLCGNGLEIARGIACDLFEKAGKIVGVIDADLAADLRDRRVAGLEQLE